MVVQTVPDQGKQVQLAVGEQQVVEKSAGPSSPRRSLSPKFSQKKARMREFDKIVKSMPSAQWILETDDFFAKKVAKPKWNNQVSLFENVGCCANGRSYFDRFRPRAKDHASKTGNLKSTWLMDNVADNEKHLIGGPKLKSPACKILYSHVHRVPTPRQNYLTKHGLTPVVCPDDPIPKPEIIAGSGYGMKYNTVAHSDFREYFGHHKQHRTLQRSVEESNKALQLNSLEKAGLRPERLPSRKRRLEMRYSQSQPMLTGPLGYESMDSSLQGTMYNTAEWTQKLGGEH
ncbi:unnamed protein product [Amoebophrya sp. A120]|nr:unnamed protein product [Amoebophrya sp. A120]|eukprot:GSA120T00016581001.1